MDGDRDPLGRNCYGAIVTGMWVPYTPARPNAFRSPYPVPHPLCPIGVRSLAVPALEHEPTSQTTAC